MGYISVATADGFNQGHSVWRALNDGEKADYLESVSVRFDKLVFRTDNPKTIWPRYKYTGTSNSRAATGRLAQIVSQCALYYADCYRLQERSNEIREENGEDTFPLDRKSGYLDSSSRWEIRDQEREKSSKIGPLDTTTGHKYGNITFFDLVEDAQDLPISIQSQLVHYCKFLTPRGKRLASQARPINYVF